MPPSKRLLCFAGTRPEAIKLAPLMVAARGSQTLEAKLVTTGQHVAVVSDVLELFGVEADLSMHMPHKPLSLGAAFGELVQQATAAIGELNPSFVVVQGDTATAAAGAVAGFLAQLPVAHVEAGLRTYDMQRPFPEEGNRRVISAVASLNACPTAEAAENLRSEHCPEDSIFVTGNTVIDALQQAAKFAQLDPEVSAFLGDRDLILLTCHRREAWDSGLQQIMRAVAQFAMAHPEVRVVFPVHPNPLVRELARGEFLEQANVLLLPPQRYDKFVALLARSKIVVTDSGGIQEEAPALGKPVLVTRETTERPEAITFGTARLVGTQSAQIRAAIEDVMSSPALYRSMATAVSPFGDGRAASRTLQAIQYRLGLGERPDDFIAPRPIESPRPKP